MPAEEPAPRAPDARAAAWFSAMLLAASRGDYQEAAAAQRALRDLGWQVERTEAPRAGRRTKAARQGGGR